MFTNLVESASHQQDLARKGRFFLATLVSYALLVACAGLASIYAYDTHVENQDLEFLGLVLPIIPEQISPTPKNAGPKAAANNKQRPMESQRTEAIDRIAAPTKIPDAVSAHASPVPEIPLGGYTIGPVNIDAVISGPASDKGPGGPGGGGTGPLVRIDTTPPPVSEKTAEQHPPTVLRKSEILNGMATSLPKPPYPITAKTVRAQGPVNVQIMINESGKIVSAHATSGNPLLRAAAVQAAYQARFNPTLLNGVPVKVSGIIVYNFTLQ